ncbi:MAG TPA: ABC-2 family transporter protein [Segeticoccus sp.]|uniref:ABC transporter permease n=1 Tax=Segeticoccus sp. TaxID=2706531 RepID=UPI002D7E4079|nr:ABC-2 family transporter protein [Segeticoccus sp.]HET8599150.1 ABC-2 family transporter protein [Segeticoccus sp.]
MAEATTTAPARIRPGRLTAYRAVLASRVRAQRSYRTSFAIDVASSFLVGLVELAEVWIIYHNVHALGGLDFHAILLVFGLADLAFSLADLAVGHCDTLPTYVRAGTLDVFYLRPQPLLAQLVTSDISLKRIARAVVGAAALAIALVVNDIHWSVSTVALLVLGFVSGAVIYAGLFVCAAGMQFFLINGAELTNSFVYGGRYAATQPASVWPGPLKLVFGFLFPVAFTAYLPALAVLGLPGPALLPAWLAWCTPLAAVWVCLMAAGLWRLGTRHYQGGGG